MKSYVGSESRRRSARKWATKNRRLNRDKCLAATRKWRKENPEKLRSYKNRRLLEPEYKLLERYRTRVWWALKRNQKSDHTETLLGCTPDQLKTHLEILFKPGMTWENYGPIWHVDHIRPCAVFDFSDPQQQRDCFHYTNLQPLFALENLSKGAKIC